MRIVVNPRSSRSAYSEREALVISRSLAEEAYREIETWPEYAVTPLRNLDRLAATLGIAELLYKDESTRLGQGSFKALGGAYAATLKLRTLTRDGPATLCCATDGNHGRSVAFAARRQGCGCVVFMHEHAPGAKERAIAALGARVIRLAGTYDDSVRHARATAAEQGWVLVPDTSEDELDSTTRHVIQGYGVMMLELLQQLATHGPPTHVFVQAGVGGLAASVAGILAEAYGAQRPQLLVVEPEAAACLLESALQGVPARVSGNYRTAMEMLSTGEASPVSWPVLQRRADVFMAIGDAVAVSTARDLRTACSHGSIDVGISGAAGVAGLVELLQHPETARLLGLGPEARVLVFGTESADSG
ncbi:MAG: diaminopropionate ammonia-lyase [Steroidobacteraceae bacterium]